MRDWKARGRWLAGRVLSVAGAVGVLAVAPLLVPGASAAAQGLPFEPTEDQLEEALTAHHPDVAAEGLPEGQCEKRVSAET